MSYPKLALGLLHYPIKDSHKRIIATNITNFDIHDIARAGTVYGVDAYFLVHPMKDQLMFVERVLDHWRAGDGAKYNSVRKASLERVRTADSLESAVQQWTQELGSKKCLRIGTHARPVPGVKEFSIDEMKKVIWEDQTPVFLLFGTGYGMTDEYMQGLDGVLESIKGAPPRDFRHLSVRSAVSIYLDRLMGSC